MTKRWINTRVEYEWDDKLNELVEISKEGYWYSGPMTLCTWLQTGIAVGTTLYGVYSQQKAGKAAAQQAKKRGAMLTDLARRRVAQRNKESYIAKTNMLEDGGNAMISSYLSSTQNIENTKSEASGSGAVMSGTVGDVIRAKTIQGDVIQQSIVQNTAKNMEAITRETTDQNEADMYAAQRGQELANDEAHSINQANQRQFLSGIMNATVAGYSAHSNRTRAGTGRYQDKAFWTKDWASWDQIKSGDFTIG
jgi:hypothetical protein